MQIGRRFIHNSILVLLFIYPTCRTISEEEIYQLEDIVVNANRNPAPISQIGNSVTVILREEIERSQVQFVSDILRSVPGVAVNRTGNTGGISQVRIRGAEGNHTLVIIDGLK